MHIYYSGGEIVRYSYYKNGWLHTVTDVDGGITTYTYDPNGQLLSTKRPNGTKEVRSYDAGGRLLEIKDVQTVIRDGAEEEGKVLTHYNFTYDKAGNIISINGTETVNTAEGISVLQSADMTYDAENRMLTYNGEKLKYDADGNMTYGPVRGEL